ncbi:MAG: pyruvate kinase, partial [Paludibacter sp.]|nr:pyruvate kinase [Paludibacter sp.]
SYGVYPIFKEGIGNTQQYFIESLQELIAKGWIEHEDSVCYLSGSFGEGFGTTFLEVNQVNKILESRDKYLLPNF